MACAIIHWVFSRVDGRWYLRKDGNLIANFEMKEEAIVDGRNRCHRLRQAGTDSQWVGHEKDELCGKSGDTATISGAQLAKMQTDSASKSIAIHTDFRRCWPVSILHKRDGPRQGLLGLY